MSVLHPLSRCFNTLTPFETDDFNKENEHPNIPGIDSDDPNDGLGDEVDVYIDDPREVSPVCGNPIGNRRE